MSECLTSISNSRLKDYYIIFKLLSGEGFSIKEMEVDFEFDYRTIKRRLAAVREALYYVFNEEVIMVYDRCSKRYYLEIVKPHLNFINFPVK